jgi:hypothetical protein
MSGTTGDGDVFALAGELTAAHLGRTVSLVHEGVLVIGQLAKVSHEMGYENKLRVYLAVVSKAWRWGHFVDSDAEIELFPSAPPAHD